MKILPPDKNPGCGYIIHLPADHPFNNACQYSHDPNFDEHHAGFPTRGLIVANYSTVKSWLGTAFGMPSWIDKVKYTTEAIIGAGILVIASGPVWVLGSGSGEIAEQKQGF